MSFERRAAFALIKRQDGKVLCVERPEAPGTWSLPGGRVERGESPLCAAVRELEEEVGIVAECARLLHSGPGRVCRLITYRVSAFTEDVPLIGPEGDRVEWLPPEALIPFFGEEHVRAVMEAK